MKKNKKNYPKISPFTNTLVFIGIFFITVVCYYGLFKTFFQQDEWQYFGSNIAALAAPHPLLTVALPFQGQLTHFFPFASLFFFFEYMLFKMNVTPYIIVNILFQTLNAFLIFLLAIKIAKNFLIAVCTSFLFATFSISHQVITWIAAGIGTFESTGFILLSLMLFLSYGDTKKKSRLYLTYFFIFTSLLFKEISLFMVFFLPLFALCCSFLDFKKRTIKNTIDKRLIGISFLVAVFYFLMRITLSIFNLKSSQPEIGDVHHASVGVYFYRILAFPWKAIAQSIIPQKVLISFANGIIHLGYPQFIASDNVSNPFISQSIVFDLVSYLISVIIIGCGALLFYFLLKTHAYSLLKGIVFSFLFTTTSVLPYIFIPGKAGYFSIFEPRDLYVPVIGVCLFIATSLFTGVSILPFKKNVKICIGIGVIVLLFAINTVSIQGDIHTLQHTGEIRKMLLTTIMHKYPHLPKQTLVYTRSNKPYYGLPIDEKILPVQSGFGRMLLVWYQDQEHFPPCLYENQYLHNLISEGFKICGGRGFGYFRSFTSLKGEVKKSNLSVSDIIAFSWDGNREIFTDITKTVRENLQKEL